MEVLDPASMSVQCYRRDFLIRLLKDPRVAGYDGRWGFDVLLSLVAGSYGTPVTVCDLGPGTYSLDRRPATKVDAQYDSYSALLDLVCAKADNSAPARA